MSQHFLVYSTVLNALQRPFITKRLGYEGLRSIFSIESRRRSRRMKGLLEAISIVYLSTDLYLPLDLNPPPASSSKDGRALTDHSKGTKGKSVLGNLCLLCFRFRSGDHLYGESRRRLNTSS